MIFTTYNKKLFPLYNIRMSKNIASIIFKQFVGIIQNLPEACRVAMDDCAFDYRVQTCGASRHLEIEHTTIDKCVRRNSRQISLDYTNICYDDLVDNDWIQYLTTMARMLLDKICPKPVNVMPFCKQECRVEPPRWTPMPCKNITIVTRNIKPVEHKVHPTVVIEQECECVSVCKRDVCLPEKQVIIRYVNEPSKKCCNVSSKCLPVNQKPQSCCR